MSSELIGEKSRLILQLEDAKRRKSTRDVFDLASKAAALEGKIARDLKRLGGIQAVQTLSRLNRSYSGAFGIKDTTFVLDFVNEAEEVLEAFRTYYTTATLEDVTDPNLVYNLRAKLDAAGHYDEFEVERVATVELNPQSKQGDLVRALEPVADRLVRQFKAAHERWKVATAESDESAVEDAHAEMETLMLFKRDMGSFPMCKLYDMEIGCWALRTMS